MGNLKKSEAKAQAEAWNTEHPRATEVSVMGDDGARWIGVIVEGAQVLGKVADGLSIVAKIIRGTLDVLDVEEVTPEGDRRVVTAQADVLVDVPVGRIRKRAIEKKRVTNPLRVELTTDERLEAGDKIADAMATIQARKSDLDTVKKKIQSEVQAAESTIEAESERLRAGYEVRSVDCDQITDFDKGIVTEIRKDTGTIANERAIRSEERARELTLFPELHAQDGQEGVQDGDDGANGDTDTQTPAEPSGKPEGATTKPEDVDEGHVETAIQVLKETKRASTSSIQRRLKIGFAAACRVMDVLEERKIVSPPGPEGGARDILVDLDTEPETE